MGWFSNNKAQKEHDAVIQQQRQAYETRKTMLFETCRMQTRTRIADQSRADRAGALASNLLTGEPHPSEQLAQIGDEDRAVAQGLVDEILADAEMREYIGDTIFWLAEALLSQGFDIKTSVQSSASIVRAKELVQLARERAGDKPLYFTLLSQVYMSENEAQKAYSSAAEGEANIPGTVFTVT
jgi:hypothetical protein